jgi:hypothetical protein
MMTRTATWPPINHLLIPTSSIALLAQQSTTMGHLQNWETAESHLTAAVQTFLDACTTLEAAALQPDGRLSNPHSFEDMARVVHSKLQLIGSVETKLARSRTSMNRLLNVSATLVPINALPLEILIRIFVLATASSTCSAKIVSKKQDMMMIVPAVCTRWRRLITGVGSFWSHNASCVALTPLCSILCSYG